jgi:HemY protein
MIRAILAFVFVAVLAVAILAVTGEAGHASIVWLGWRVDLTATALILIVLGAALVAMLAWRLLLWVIEAPRRAERARAETRRRQAVEVLTRGFLAAAAGDGAEARRLAAKAAEIAVEAPGLVRVLAAQAAEAAGDATATQAAYSAMLGFPEMRLAGHKGMMQLALAQGDRAGAVRHAEQAYGQARTARWAWRALLEARLEDGDWEAARDLVKGALDRKIVSPIVAERSRAALLAASAAQLETAPEPKARAQAVDYALEAAKLQPGFAPGVVMAARLLADAGKQARAAQVIETAWKVAPHPALWLAYRDLKTNETPRERAQRLADLAAMNAGARESHILRVEAWLIAGEPARAREAGQVLENEPMTARIAGLMARAAFAAGQADEARVWMGRGRDAPGEPDWSDLDPEGRAFAYLPSDWARLVASFAETGELIHPRHERRERGLTELPDLPISYADQPPFLAQAVEPVPYDVGDGVYDEADEDETPPPPPRAGQRRPLARRRLASAPRAAK